MGKGPGSLPNPLGFQPVPPRHPRAFRRADPKSSKSRFWGACFCTLSNFWWICYRPQNLLNSGSQNSPKSPKSHLGTILASVSVVCLDPFWHQFSLYFSTPRKVMFCNTYNWYAKCLFLPPKSFHFGTINSSQNNDLFRRFPGHTFLLYYVDSIENNLR